MILSCCQGGLEVISDLLELLTLMKFFPVLTQDIFNSAHVNFKSSFNLLSPDNLVGNSWEPSDSIEHCRLMLLRCLVVEEFVSKHLNIFLYLS